jgi:transposase-like protein
MDVGPSEAETHRTDFLRKLARRGVKLVISDAHEGINASVAKVMNATWQRCRVHFMRNVCGPAVDADPKGSEIDPGIISPHHRRAPSARLAPSSFQTSTTSPASKAGFSRPSTHVPSRRRKELSWPRGLARTRVRPTR